MKTKSTIILLAASLFFFGCNKRNDNPDPNGGSMADLVVSDDFSWTAAIQGTLTVTLENPLNVSTEDEFIQVVNADGRVLDRTIVHNSTAEFQLNLPADGTYYVYYPVTEDSQKITGTGAMNLLLGPAITYIYPQTKSTAVVSCTSCGTPIQNAGGELPYLASGYTMRNDVDVPGWSTTATDHKIEMWVSGFQGVPSQEGRQFFELNANQVAALYQELCLEPGSTIRWSVWHRGRQGVDVAEVLIGPSVATAVRQATMTDGKTAWGHYSGTYNVPIGQTTTFFVFKSISAAGGSQSIGNFLDNFDISCDADGDGIIDRYDEYPGDPNTSYTSYFPESGNQILAFEDLWPSLGDFDFNDLVLSNKVAITKNAAGIPLTASFKVSIDAIGASIDNGFALRFVKPDKTLFPVNIIAGVTGAATLDPANTNGLILSNDVYATINDRYQNNGEGPVGVPDTLKFTVTFNAQAGNFIPEIYLFRTGDRGHEVHRSGFPATATMNTSLMNTQNDAGNFKTATGLPWAIEIITDQRFKCAIEKTDITRAYGKFKTWAESTGTVNPTWYLEPIAGKVVVVPF